MSSVRQIMLPLSKADLASFKAGEELELSGSLLVGRDQAHLRMVETLDKGEDLPFSLGGETIYYMGPAPTPPGKVIGSSGPTTAYRMDPFAPLLLDKGLKGMIGKGPRNDEVARAITRNGGVYFYSFGGCGALYARCIKEAVCLAYEDLGPEAVYRLRVEKFPVIVAMDARGGSVY